MRQSTIIFGTLLFAFVMYITLREQLPDYLNLFTGKSSGDGNSSANAASSISDLGEAANKAVKLGQNFSNMGLNFNFA